MLCFMCIIISTLIKDILNWMHICIYWVTHKLPQIYTANHATFPIQIRKITVHICGKFWVTQYGRTPEYWWCGRRPWTDRSAARTGSYRVPKQVVPWVRRCFGTFKDWHCLSKMSYPILYSISNYIILVNISITYIYLPWRYLGFSGKLCPIVSHFQSTLFLDFNKFEWKSLRI